MVSNFLLACDADLCRPFGSPIQHALLDLFHLRAVRCFVEAEHFLDLLKDFWFVPLSDLHAVLQDHDDVLGSVLRSMLGALLCSS